MAVICQLPRYRAIAKKQWAGTLNLGFTPPELRATRACGLGHLVCGIFLWLPEWFGPLGAW